MKNITTLKLATVLILLVLLPVSGCAENSTCGDKGPQEPPPEAIDACKDKHEGDSVTFTGRQGESLTSTCKTIKGQLVAVPEGFGGHHKPPQEAVDACKDKQEGDSVTLTGRQGESLTSTCKTIVGQLIAVTEGLGGHHRPPQEAFDACKAKKEGDRVTLTGRQGESLTLTCKNIKGTLVATPEGHGPQH